jgi:uncharacterized protein (TIGR01244 family)
MEGTKVSDDMTVTGQVTEEQLRQASGEGFRSVLNLRAPEEEGVLANEKEVAEKAGLSYINIPVRKEEISDELTTQVLSEIDRLPKPALIHCSKGMRAGAMAFMHMATRGGLSAEEAMAKAQEKGFDCNSEPELKQFFEHYVTAHGGNATQ